MKKRSHGDGSIDTRGDTHRLRYMHDGKRHTKTFQGTKAEAQRELRAWAKSGDTGEFVAPTKITVEQWMEEWLDAGAPGRRRKKVSQRTLERYGQLMRTHVKPALGKRPLQQLRANEIDRLYVSLEGKIAPRTAHHVHTVLGAMLGTAERKGMIPVNPMARVEQVPTPEGLVSEDEPSDESSDIGEGLDEVELAALVRGFKSSSLYPVVGSATASGARRNELLALRWTDLDTEAKTIRIERAWEQTKKYGLRLKPPKTKRGLRTVPLDAATFAMLLAEKQKHQRLQAGIPDGVAVELSLIRLPAGALMFPHIPAGGEAIDLTVPRNPRNFSKEFARRAKVIAKSTGMPQIAKTRFHDLRGIHATALLDAGIPVHTVAQRIGDDPAVLLRNYAKRKRSKTADVKLFDAIEALATSFLTPG